MFSERAVLLSSTAILAISLFSWALWLHAQGRSSYAIEKLLEAGTQFPGHAREGRKAFKYDHRIGSLYTCGVNEARLARDGPPDLFQRAQEDLDVAVVAGSRHTLFATPDGAVYTCGKNDSSGGGGHGSHPIPDSGQLGRSGTSKCGQVIRGIAEEKVVGLAAGRYHSVALTQSGTVYTWGLNDWGQLGRSGKERDPEEEKSCQSGYRCKDAIPGIVSGLLESVKIVRVSAGRYWTLAVSETGELYTWGFDGCGSDGVVPEADRAWEPRLVTGDLLGKEVVDVDSGYVFWIAITAPGHVFTCNTGDDGYASTLSGVRKGNDQGELGRNGSPFLPGQVTWQLGNKRVVAVAAGRQHALAATSEGWLFSWGMGGSVLGRYGDHKLPGRVPLEDQIQFVAGGEYFSLAASSSHVYGFGKNGYKTLSHPEREVFEPQQITGPLAGVDFDVLDVQAGYQHSLILAHVKSHARGEHPLVEGKEVTEEEEIIPDPLPVEEQKNNILDVDLSQLYQTFPGFEFSDGDSEVVRLNPFSYLEYQVNSTIPSIHETMEDFQPSAEHSTIVQGSADVFQMLPAKYDSQFKNPCWFENDELKCLPFFSILGVSKCGTTDLYSRLVHHKQVYNSKNKGPHFWDECKWPPQGMCTVPPDGGFGGYIELFSDAAAQIKEDKIGIVGEASSNTFTGVLKYYRGTGKKLSVNLVDLLHEAQPYLRLIVIFRNPVDRYFSAYHYYRNREQEGSGTAEAFHTSTVTDVEVFLKCVTNKGRKQCIEDYAPQQLVKGMYSEFVEYWTQVFPRNQILFFRTEDYTVALRAHMKAVFQFLGVKALNVFEMDMLEAAPRSNHQQSHEPMLPKTRELLTQFYAPFNQQLAQHLKDRRFLWQDV